MTKLHQVAELGQSIWLDFIRRSFITSGELQELIDTGLRGMTSNPSIFEKAIVDSADYDVQLRSLVNQGHAVDAIYQALVIEDIQRAAERPALNWPTTRRGPLAKCASCAALWTGRMLCSRCRPLAKACPPSAR
jgi:hypothetical protein